MLPMRIEEMFRFWIKSEIGMRALCLRYDFQIRLSILPVMDHRIRKIPGICISSLLNIKREGNSNDRLDNEK